MARLALPILVTAGVMLALLLILALTAYVRYGLTHFFVFWVGSLGPGFLLDKAWRERRVGR